MSRFRCELVSPADAAAFWEDSPEASVFTNPAVLSRAVARVDWWLVSKGDEALCLWPVCLPAGAVVGLPEFFYYVGPMWSPGGLNMPAHRCLATSTQVYERLLGVLVERYGAVHAQLPLGATDVRVFDWWNYHNADLPRFEIAPRYTACIRGLQGMTADALQSAFRAVRRQEVKRATRSTALVRVTDWTSDDLLHLYEGALRRQCTDLCPEVRSMVVVLLDIVAGGFGEVMAFRDDTTGELASIVLLLFDKRAAHLVLNLTASRWRGGGVAAWTVYQAIQAAQARGAEVFDFNGANSPTRGDDKHSYGAAAELFFEIAYPANRCAEISQVQRT